LVNQSATIGAYNLWDNVSVKEVTEDTNIPRLDYTGGGCPSLLLEPLSTNLVTHSEDFSDASWINGSSTDTSNYSTSPDGLNNSTRFLTTANTASFLYINNLPILDATNYTLSFWVKSNGNSLDKFRLYTTTAGTSSELTSTNEWVRYEYSFLSTGTTTNIGLRGVIGQETDVQIWGAQLEDLPYATSYIPTSGQIASRLADKVTGAGDATTFNSTEGVLYVEIAALADDGTNRYITLNSGIKNDSVRIYYNSLLQNQISIQVRSADVVQAIYNYTLSDTRDFIKVAISYKLNEFKMYVNGSLVHTDTSGNTPIGLSELGFDSAGADPFFGKVKDVRTYNTALTDTELTELTTI